MNRRLKNIPLGILAGCAAAFMMYPILEYQPLILTMVLTAANFGFAGYIFYGAVRSGLWYSGVLLNIPFWLLTLWVNLTAESGMPAIQASALVSAYAGMLVYAKYRHPKFQETAAAIHLQSHEGEPA